jgi:NAD-dependent deacetylase
MEISPEVVSALSAASKVLVLTGSGASAESGVPTFREAQSGLWENFDPHQLATPDAFLNDPQLVWRWYRWRRELVSGVEPNPGHFALARLQGLVEQLTLVTQNVDGLHQKAGSEPVIEYHGNLFATHCFNLCPAAGEEIDAGTGSEVPRCPTCGGFLRPGVVWFGEPIPPAALMAADEAARQCDVFLSVGTSSLVWPAAGLGELAMQAGATIIEINLDATPLTEQSHFILQGKSGEVLPELVNSLIV